MNYTKKVIFCGAMLLLLQCGASAQTVSDTTAMVTDTANAAPKTGFRRAVEAVFGKHEPIIRRGIQHTAFLQNLSGVLGAGYDMRWRTPIRWVDFAINGGVGYRANQIFPSIYVQNYKLYSGNAGAFALFGKRALSFELGAQASVFHYEYDQLVVRSYVTNEDTYARQSRSDYLVEIPAGVRFQPVTGGLYVATRMGYGWFLNNYPRANVSILIGLGYTFPTRSRS